MTKLVRHQLTVVETVATTDKGWAARLLAPLHRSAATAKDAREIEALAYRLALPVEKVNGCLVAQ